MDWHLRVGDLLAIGSTLGGLWLFSVAVIRSINGKFSAVAVTLARLDERVTRAAGDAARAHERIDELANRE